VPPAAAGAGLAARHRPPRPVQPGRPAQRCQATHSDGSVVSLGFHGVTWPITPTGSRRGHPCTGCDDIAAR